MKFNTETFLTVAGVICALVLVVSVYVSSSNAYVRQCEAVGGQSVFNGHHYDCLPLKEVQK